MKINTDTRIALWFVLGIAVLCLLTLGGCGTVPQGGGPSTTLAPVCEFAGPPIKYNAKNKDSVWHAGPKLAKRIDQQDDAASNLNCPGYR